ncbi:MAG: hypothetical protein IJM71_02405 [Clostridia bacterium]|nr:hypothetical protein [Clostridia bacterium]
MRWKYYNPNPLSRNVGDCAVRAVAAALNVSWEEAYAMIAEAGFNMADVMPANDVWGSVLRRFGFYRMEIPHDCPDCYTAEDFARENPVGTFVAVFKGHVATIHDGMILDTWDSSDEIVRYIWYRKDGR